MNIPIIKTTADYQNALKRLEILFDAPLGTPESDEADVLALLIDEYERKDLVFVEAVKTSLTEVELHQQGKITLQSAKDFLDEL